jgi:hypothetical protein
MPTYLITADDIREFKTLSVNIPDERINPFILEAQIMDLRKVTGKDLYNKLVEEVSPMYYPELKEHYKGFLAYRAYYRILSNNQATVTSNGVVMKLNDNSEQLNPAALAVIRNSVLDGSKVYEEDFIDFMNLPASVIAYPEWANSDCYCKRSSPNPSVRISAAGAKIKINDAANDLNNRNGYNRSRWNKYDNY